MINWRKGEPKIWRWRIRGRSSDSQIVTLVAHKRRPVEGGLAIVRIEDAG